jgi:AraC-like DNA-binding protein
MARPRIDIDTEQFEKLCFMQCTLKEIAGWFKCSEDTIERWCKRELKMSFADAYERYSAGGKISLRRYQWKMAEHNCSMAIFLGKQYLGQSDQQELKVSKSDDETIKEMEQYFNDKRTGAGVTLG